MKSLSAAVLVIASCLPTAGLAQGKGDGSGDGSGSGSGSGGGDVGATEGQKTRYEQRPDGIFEITQHANGTETERLLPPDEARFRRESGEVALVDGQQLCRVEAHPNPRRLAPGESGELRVLVTMAGNSVALPGGRTDLSINPIEGFQFGTSTIEPASPGTLAGKFQGKLVYDDFMLIRVPLTVAASVKSPAKQFVTGTLMIELRDGQSGERLGRFACPLTGRIDIGKSLPTFRGAARSKSKRAAKSKRLAKSKIGSPTKSETVPGKVAPIVEGLVRDTNSAGSDPEEPAAGSTVEGADGDTNLLAWGFGGFGVLVLLWLVLVRRR